MDANDDKHNIESKLREILGYLHTLGVNIQKRTQHLLDSRIKYEHLRSVKNLDRVAEKVNTICELSVISLNKVNNGIKVTIENEKLKVKSCSKEMEKEGKPSSQCDSVDETRKHKPHSSKHKHSSHTIKSNREDVHMAVVEDANVPECKRKRLTVGDEEVSLPEEVTLDVYSNCSVRLSPQDSSAVSDFASGDISMIGSEKNSRNIEDKKERKKGSRIKSRPRHSQLTDHSLPDESSCDDISSLNNSSNKETSFLEDSGHTKSMSGESRESSSNNLEIKDKKGWEKTKSFKRIIHSDSSEDETSKEIKTPDFKMKSEERKKSDNQSTSEVKKEPDDKKIREKETKTSSSDVDECNKSPDKRISDKKRLPESERSSEDKKSSYRSSKDGKSTHRSDDRKSSHRSDDRKSSHRSSEDRPSSRRSSDDRKSSHRSSDDRKSSHRSPDSRKSSHRSSEESKSSSSKPSSDRRKSDEKRPSDDRKSLNKTKSFDDSEVSDREIKSESMDVSGNSELLDTTLEGNTSDHELLDDGKSLGDTGIVVDTKFDKESSSDGKSELDKDNCENEKSVDDIESNKPGDTIVTEGNDDASATNHSGEVDRPVSPNVLFECAGVKNLDPDENSSHSIILEPVKKQPSKPKRNRSENSKEDETNNESSCGSKRILDDVMENEGPNSDVDENNKTSVEEVDDCLGQVLDMCNKIVVEIGSNMDEERTEPDRLDWGDVVTISKDSNTEPDSLARNNSDEQINTNDNKETSKDNETACESPPYYPSDNEGFGEVDNTQQPARECAENVAQTEREPVENKLEDEVKSKEDADVDKETEKSIEGVDGDDDSHKPLIRCVNIQSLLSNDIKENPPVSKKQGEKPTPKKHKIVTFLETPIRIKNSKFNNNFAPTPPKVTKKPTSILLNKKCKYMSSWSSDCVIELSDSDSDVSNTTRELMKNIKNNILEGKSETFVNVSRDEFLSTNYTESFSNHGIKKVYNEDGKLYFSEKQKKLNEDAKKSVLTSSSSDEGLRNKRNQQDKLKLMVSSSDSDSESPDFGKKTCAKKRRKKKFTKKRHRKTESDSDEDLNLKKLLKFSKSKRRRSSKHSSDESSDNRKNSSDDEMGRSARLKQREAPTAFTQSNKDRNESDSSSSSSLSKAKTQVSNNTSKTESSKGGSVLLDTLINGDDGSKSTSDSDQSITDKNDTTNSTTASNSTEKPLADKIKNDLLEDESSSSAQESIPKVNGKDKKKASETKKDVKKMLIEDSDEDDQIQTIESDVEEESSSKRPSSTINLDTDSDDSIKVTKTKIKKSAQNGKKDNSDGSEELDKEANSDSNESEIFVPSKRKRKPKKKSSSSCSDGENSQDSETKTTKKRKRIKKMSGDESSGGEDGSGSEGEGNKKGRKNIRALKKTSHLDSATREAAKKERERLARIAERQKLYNESMFDESGGPEEIAKLDKIVLDFDPKTKDPIITVDKGLVQKLKPHQANGIKFMWNACFESVKQINTSKGSGCILAHCMGLGKTLQVVTLVHTLLLHKEKTNVERVLVVCPLSTVLNWVNEFRMWLEHAESDEEIGIYELSRYKQNHERAYQLKEWLEEGGVCILGYDMFRNLSADNPKKFRKAQLTAFQKSLIDPGPDLVVCDEGHLLKNEKTSISQSMNRVRTLRRIVLTGTPLQNNLKEYYCMVQFVKPNLLGKYSEYLNRFVNPITNGQYTNSTDHDIKIMKRRSHVLHKMLDGAVQRRDYAVLAPFLPPKHEYVLFISLTDIQIKLYRHYLENYSRRPNPDRKTTPSLFSDFQSLQRIWTHPLVLKANSERYELMQQKKRDKEEEEEESEGSLADFIDDEEDTTTPEETSMSESDDSDDSDRPTRKKNKKKKSTKAKHKRITRATAVTTVKDEDEDDDVMEVKMEEPKAENPTEWWMSLCSEEELNDIRHSNKLLLLLDILKECEAIGDKLLVFSQSLYSLDLIEQFLSKIDEATQKGSKDDHLGGHSGSWSQGLDYFRLDGSTSCENRAIWCKAFNREDNPRARLFLISTRAGGLGINLVAANRVVIFDMSWNPSHDVQSIFRVYRFGQKKPCYIYRFLALGTMEEKIYERQVTKQAISKRVIDEQQIDRHYNESDLAELYIFNPEPEGSREVPILPKDRLFADLLKQHDTVIYKYHEHDSLLENKEEETLTEEERKAAWEDYENEKTRPPPTFGGANWLLMQQQQQQQQMTINALQAVLRQDYPTLTEQQITAMIPAILQQMHTNGDAALTQKLGAMMAAQNNMLGGQMPGFKYNPNMLTQGMMMNPGAMSLGIRNPMYQQAWQQQQQQLQMQRLQQQQAMQANMKYYAGGLGSRDLMDMAALQQQQRALLLGSSLQPSRGRPPKTVLRPQRPINANEVVDLDSE